MTEKLMETSTGNDEGAKMSTKTKNNIATDNDNVDVETVEANMVGFPDQNLLALKNDILNFLCQNNEIYFKSQQIDDPELTIDEKKEIANDILKNSHRKFLLRFGKYLQSEHLKYFDIEDKTKMNEEKMEADDLNNEEYEVKLLIKDLQKNIEHKQKNIKNRRYAAMQAMIKENNYFSEKEMMQREPHLYEELVGQYLTEAEKRIRDSYDPKNTTFTKIVLDNYDKELMNELRRKQEHEEEQLEQMSEDTISESSFKGRDESSEYSSSGINEQQNTTISSSQNSSRNRQQWGNFEDDNDELTRKQNKSGTSSTAQNSKLEELKKGNKLVRRKKQLQKQIKCITAGEREMLRQEFIGIMYSKFLEGKDKDFDYSKVDSNSDLDDLKQIGQDDEDEYFDRSDDDDNNDIDRMAYRDKIDRMDEDTESEDDLDVYMKHLNQHLSLQKREADF